MCREVPPLTHTERYLAYEVTTFPQDVNKCIGGKMAVWDKERDAP